MKTNNCPHDNKYLCVPAARKSRQESHTHRVGWGGCWMEIFQRHQLPRLPLSFSSTFAKTSSLLSLGVTVLHRQQPNGMGSCRGFKIPWGLQRSRFSSPSYHKSAQLQTPDSICTASRNLVRALIIQPTRPWKHWWLLPRQYLELGMSLSLSRRPGVLGLHEEGWKPPIRNQKGPDFHPRECSAPAALDQCEEWRHQPSLHLGGNGDEDRTWWWTWAKASGSPPGEEPSFPTTNTRTRTPTHTDSLTLSSTQGCYQLKEKQKRKLVRRDPPPLISSVFSFFHFKHVSFTFHFSFEGGLTNTFFCFHVTACCIVYFASTA